MVASLWLGAQTTHQLSWGNDGSDAGQALTIEVGDTVEWTWGAGTHNLVSTSGVETFNSGYETSGFVWSHTFTLVGSTDYECSPHAGNMNGTITVEEASAGISNLSLQGILDFSLPSKYFRGFHLKATADIADLSIYSMETYSSGDRLTANNVYTLSGSASAGDDILFWFSNAENAANIYMNASNIFDVVVDESANNWNGYNGDDPLTLSMNGTVVETYGELGVDGTGQAWEYTDTWAYKVDGAWTHADVNCTDGSYYMWDSECVYPLAVGQQATGASTDLVTAFSHDLHTMSQPGLWYNEGEAPIVRVTSNPADSEDAMKYTDDGSQAYSNMQIQFTSKVDMSSMNTFTVDVYVDGTTMTGTAPANLALKLQDSSEGTPWTNQNVIIQDITADTWTTLTFAFNDDASMSRDDVDRIVVQFNGEGNNDQVTAYMKNMVGSYTEPVATLYTDVTFTVNTANIEVGANGMYLGGGIIGDATAHAMTDADGDGTWEVTLTLQEGVTGNYIFLNSPNDGGDWGAKEVLTGQECADGQYDDRLLAPVGADDYTLQHCFGNCYIDGTCGPVGPCDSALALTPGTTQTGNTADFGDLFDDSSCLGSYDGGDDALFMYTATADGETLDVTVSGQGTWSGVAMSLGCPTEGGEVCVGSQTSSGSDPLNFISDPLIAGEVYYIHISTYPSPQTTDFILDTAVIAAPSCLTPTALTATDVTYTGATLSWDSNGTAFMVELQPTGSAQGTAGGYVIGDVENLTTTSVTIPEGSLAPNTSYDFFVINICGEGDLSEYAGPSTFYTGYCQSIPTSNDGTGINEVVLGDVTFTSGGDITYEDFTATTVDVNTSENTNLQITFGAGYTYNTHVWIDLNNDLVYDNATELLYSGESTSENPTTLDASFQIPSGAVGNYNMRIGTADSGQATPNPCYSGAYGVTVDMVVNVVEPVANVTFNIDTANITVGATGMYVGGGVLGGSDAYAMSDDDNDGIWSVTIPLAYGTTGNYIFLNGPTFDADWGTKEDLSGQSCADPDNYNDRILPEIAGDMSITYCFATCEETCPVDPCADVTGTPAIADDFDGNLVDINEWVGDNDVTFAIVDGASVGATSNVLQYVDPGTGFYANLQLRTCNKFDMQLTNTFTMDVYIDGSSVTGGSPNQVAFKLQNSDLGGNAWQTQIEQVVAIDAVDTWQTVEFNFTGTDAMTRDDIDQVVIQFNSEANNDAVTAYIDNLQSSNTLGLDDVNPVSSFNFYPNPVNDMLTIKAQASIDSITVYNMLGQAVVRSTPNTTDSTLDMSALQAGAYFVQVSINNTLKTVRVVKN